MTDITLHRATTSDDFAEIEVLCWAYRDFLLNHTDIDREITETFYPVPKYEALMAELPVLHARPKGLILLARDATGAAAGCGMSYPFAPQTSEIKRVFVTEAARGKGVAERICTALVAQAREDGFDRVVLDTSKSLHAAQRLYTRLGFGQRGPYQDIPAHVLPELVFFEKSLKQRTSNDS